MAEEQLLPQEVDDYRPDGTARGDATQTSRFDDQSGRIGKHLVDDFDHLAGGLAG